MLTGINLHAQSKVELSLIQDHLVKMTEDSDMQFTDVEEIRVTDVINRKSLGARTVYVQQMVNGIPVHNAINSFTIKDNKVYTAGNAFAKSVAKDELKKSTSLEQNRAIHFAGVEVKADLINGYRPLTRINDLETIFESPDVYGEKITVTKEYLENAEGRLDLAWRVVMAPKNSADHWSILMDANSGVILDKENYTTYCSFPEHGHFLAVQEKTTIKKSFEEQITTANMMMGAQYNVVALPTESPNYGDHSIVTDPHDLTASPFGWHDLDGVEGAETTTLNGNNAFVQVDRNDDLLRDPGSVNPDGGTELHFDYAYDESLEPTDLTEAAMVNAFYTNNMMHDFSYRYGFDENVNFQSRNYTGAGIGGDAVRVNVQTGLNLTPQLTNNATFSTPTDGSSGSMRIFVGNNGGGSSTRIISPAGIAGGITVGLADYGNPISSTAVSGTVVQGINDDENPTFGCSPYSNVAEVTGNIALVDRGECEFELKSWYAEEAGAIALIICNFEDAANGMTGGTDFPNSGLGPVTIPSVMVSSSDCDRIKMNLSQGVEMTLQLAGTSGPSQRDISFDNGVLSHEYGHGLSTRSTGGPSNSGCLNNSEQMGEGWSDYFGLVTSVLPTQDGSEARGTGTYAFGQAADDSGIRRQPYSTNPDVNNQTYATITGDEEVHNVGEVWTDATWDMYWLFVQEYGFDDDFINGTGGNNIAIQLVFDGMLGQQCRPGFVSGRDAILTADEMRYGGANSCLIWRAFAKRGLGINADEGSTNNNSDNTEDFNLPPGCVDQLLIAKSVTSDIMAGDVIKVDITISNFKNEISTGVVIEDEIPSGTTFLDGPAGSQVINGKVNIPVGDMQALEEMDLTYNLSTDANRSSSIFYQVDMEDIDIVDQDWDTEDVTPGENSSSFFDLIQGDPGFAYSGENYWSARAMGDESDIALINIGGVTIDVSTTNPFMRFFHRYDNIQAGSDGGFVQIREVGASSWTIIRNDRLVRNKYRGNLAYATITLPFVDAFYGGSGGYLDSYVDLSEWSGKTINLRFRFATDDDNTFGGLWSIDDVEIMNLVSYNGEACVTSSEGENTCTEADEYGTIVQGIVTKTLDLDGEHFDFEIFPNPAVDHLSLQFNSTQKRDVLLSVFTIEGRRIHQQEINLESGLNQTEWNFGQLPSGIYIAKILVDGQIASDKFVIESK